MLVADGASESFLARQFAARLADSVSTCGWSGLEALIRRAVDAWPTVEARYRRDRENSVGPLPWFEEEKLSRGAHATVIAARFLPATAEGEQRVVLESVGDACAFMVRDGWLLRSHPPMQTRHFGSTPDLVSSLRDDLGRTLGSVRCAAPVWSYGPGDSFFLCSDALAHWFLSEIDGGGRPWDVLDRHIQASSDHSGFDRLVDELRTSKALRNDDVTLVRVVVG